MLVSIKNRGRHNVITDVEASSNICCPHSCLPGHVQSTWHSPSCFTLGTSIVHFAAMWFMSLDPCWVPIPSARMLSLCARANKHLQPNPSEAREKWEMLSWWQKQLHCQKREEWFPDYSSLQIHWFNFNPQIKQWEWYIGYSVSVTEYLRAGMQLSKAGHKDLKRLAVFSST